MLGQGRPTNPRAGPRWLRTWLALFVAGLVATARAVADEPAPDVTWRLEVLWQAEPPRAWRGTLALDRGTLDNLTRLGTSPDAVAATWLADDRVEVAQPRPQASDGFAIDVAAPADAALELRLGGYGGEPSVQVVPLSQLRSGTWEAQLPPAGRLRVRRVPGDQLGLSWAGDRLVFAPRENWKFTVAPRGLAVTTETRLRLTAELREASGGRVVWQDEREFNAGPDEEPSGESLAFSLELPAVEGAYELSLAAQARRFTRKSVVASRRVSLLVLGTEAPPEPVTPAGEFRQLLEIDPAQPQLLERFTNLNLRPGRRRGAAAQTKAAPAPAVSTSELPPAPNLDEASWHSYSLTIGQPLAPHLVELELPGEAAQQLALGVFGSAGPAVAPGLLSYQAGVPPGAAGLVLTSTPAGSPEAVRHRFLCWPGARKSTLVMANPDPSLPATFQRCRILGGPARLPARDDASRVETPRRWLAVCDGPALLAWLGTPPAAPTSDEPTHQGWADLLRGATRWAEYLRYAGYDGALVSVAGQGSALYPSRLLDPQSAWDHDAGPGAEPDPVRKDQLELLFRACDRAGLVLVPVLELTTPLPALEPLRRAEDSRQTGLEPIGAEGLAFSRRYPSADGQSVYYNPLDSRVQAAVVELARELVDRYAAHRAWGGCALSLAGSGFGQFPGSTWLLDDATWARFEQATGRRQTSAADDPQRFRLRGQAVEGELREAWETWRAGELALLHQRLAALDDQAAPQAPLWLAGSTLFDNPAVRRALAPRLPLDVSAEGLLRQIGYDLTAKAPEVTLPRLWRREAAVPGGPVSAESLLEPAGAWDRATRDAANPAGLVASAPVVVRWGGPEGGAGRRGGPSQLRAEAHPSGAAARATWIAGLAATDARVLCETTAGLAWLPEPEDEEARAAFRGLPAVPFRDVEGTPQPLVLRVAQHAEQSWLYLVNPSPWPLTVELPVVLPDGARATNLAPGRQLSLPEPPQSGNWRLELRPFDLIGLVFSDSRARVGPPRVELPEDLPAALDAQIKELGQRASQLARSAPLAGPPNRDFEQPAADDNLPGWGFSATQDVEWNVGSAAPHGGQQALVVESQAPSVALSSEPFELPATGRASVLVWLRAPDAAREPPLRLGIEGRLADQPRYFRYAQLGPGSRQRIGGEWEAFRFHVDNLPLAGLREARIRLELLGPGTIEIDDVEVSPLFFNEAEQRALQLVIFGAYDDWQKQAWGDCWRGLSGYWPRFLETHVTLETSVVAERPRRATGAPPPPPPPEEKSPGFFERMRRWVPKLY